MLGRARRVGGPDVPACRAGCCGSIGLVGVAGSRRGPAPQWRRQIPGAASRLVTCFIVSSVVDAARHGVRLD